MIDPDEIRRKAERLYGEFLRAWLAGEQFFPKSIPCNKTLDKNLSVAATSVQRLKSESKEVKGYGYTIEWEERKSRTHGRNQFPKRILFETQDDFLRCIGKRQEFACFAAAVDRLRSSYPQLEQWIRSHTKALIAAAPQLDGLLEVLDFFHNNPRPGRFSREVPVSVNTKFIEANRSVLRGWFDLVLPSSSIRSDEEQFDRRYGLRLSDPQFLIRFLDPEIQQRSGSPWDVCSIFLDALETQPIECPRILIIENRTSLLTLPSFAGAVAIWGMGNAVAEYSRQLTWLSNRDVWYWGDIDVAGLQILSRLRTFLPHVRSLLMDDETVGAWRERIGASRAAVDAVVPGHLTPGERAAFEICASDGLWIEQERFPQQFVQEHFDHLFAERVTTTGLTQDFELHLAQCVEWACRLEVMAKKPGNVHPEAEFGDLTFRDFLESAAAISPVLAQTQALGVGRAIFEGIRQTCTRVSSNSNLGIALLIAPLAAVPRDESLQHGLPRVLNALTRVDADAVYRAIRLAQPGGMGTVDDQDVSSTPNVTLLEAMRMAAERDTVAAQYANGFRDVLEFGLPFLAGVGDFRARWEIAIVGLHLRLMARSPDTLIARKCGPAIASESAHKAQQVIDACWPESENGRLLLEEFDAWLRADGNRRNPGTTADLVAACLFAAFRERIFDVSDIVLASPCSRGD
jgi:triphosphoribosyl-dephospho-CoA synthetase